MLALAQLAYRFLIPRIHQKLKTTEAFERDYLSDADFVRCLKERIILLRECFA
jgi:hypothetical protein